MGVMCSLFGHDYGDPAVEREREEEGTEVVVSAKRIERCRNCGHERTIAENTEVTALSAAAGVVREPDGTVVVPPDDAVATDDATAVDGDSTGPKPLGTARQAEGSAAMAGSETAGSEATGNGTPSTAGGSIADAVTATSALERPTAGPAHGTADGSRGADADEDEPAVDRIRDGPAADDIEPDDRPHRAPGEWPAEPERAPRAVRDGGTDEPAVEDGARRDGEVETIDGGASRPAGGSFACSSCGFDAAVADSSLRAGDICPHCGVGYLALETRKG